MPDGDGALTARIIERIGDIPAAQWDALAGPDNPFVSHAFLHALEITGCATERAGWLPHHIVIEDAAGLPVAVAPLYLKGHSQGEYVFDHGWAHAWERAGGQYYPKLQVAAPFSPVSGPRLLAGSGPQSRQGRMALIHALEAVCQRMNLSSAHVTFCTQDEWELLGAADWVQRVGRQFHWHNQGYESFDDFLGTLISRKRKSIRKERREVAEQGIDVQPYSGAAIEARHWDAFYRFYIDTYDRKWGHPYLTREFFDELQTRLADKVVLVMAERDGQLIAGALNIRGSDALFGRNWGAAGDFKHLHFEACYYQAIEYAINHKLARVEAGTQGPHKIQRGYLPVETYSAHYIPNDSFRRAVEDFCAEERREVEYEMRVLEAERSPYRQAGEN